MQFSRPSYQIDQKTFQMKNASHGKTLKNLLHSHTKQQWNYRDTKLIPNKIRIRDSWVLNLTLLLYKEKNWNSNWNWNWNWKTLSRHSGTITTNNIRSLSSLRMEGCKASVPRSCLPAGFASLTARDKISVWHHFICIRNQYFCKTGWHFSGGSHAHNMQMTLRLKIVFHLDEEFRKPKK